MGEKKTKAQGHIPAPLYRLYTAPTWPEGFMGCIQPVNLARRLYGPYTACNPL